MDTLVSVDTLNTHLDDPEWVVFDCRFSLTDPTAGERAYQEGHIAGARYAHLERDLSGPITDTSGRHPLPDPQRLAAKLGRWGVGGETQVVAYDDAGGAMAARLWWLLRWLGHPAAAVLDGGLARWTDAGYPLTAEIPQCEPKTFAPHIQTSFAIEADEVAQGLSDGAVAVVDARAAARFRGEEEPIDPVAGHIPGAVNRPFQENLNDDGTFVAPARLRRAFEALLDGRSPGALIHMCGSGVTACHNLLAMELAGLTGSRLYPGSFSEWVRDPERPVVQGKE